jgi:hypothetical protein
MLVQLALQTFDLPSDLTRLRMFVAQFAPDGVQPVAELADPRSQFVLTTAAEFQFLTLAPLGHRSLLLLALARDRTVPLAPLGGLLASVDPFHRQPDGSAALAGRMRQQPGTAGGLFNQYKGVLGCRHGEPVWHTNPRALVRHTKPGGLAGRRRGADGENDGENQRERTGTAHD